MIGDRIFNSMVLDLFAGTGSLGIESLSRGCKLVYFVDKSIRAVKIIEYNIGRLRNVEGRYKIIRGDALEFLHRFNKFKWDIVFLDPPYKINPEPMKRIFEILASRKITDSDSLIVYEFFFKKDIKSEIGDLCVIKESHFGDKNVVYLRP